MSHTTRTHGMPAKAVALRVTAQVEAYDWLAYSYDLSQPSYGHRIAPDGFRYFMRLYGQTFTR